MYWVIQFDQILDARNDSGESICSNGLDYSALDWLSYNTSADDVSSIINANPAVFDPPDDDSFGDDITSTDRWLISIITSYSLSVFITGPIIAFFMQSKRICMYDPHKDINEEYFFSLYESFV